MFLSGVFPNRAGPISAGQVVVVAMSTCAGVLLRTAKKQAVLVVSDFLFYLHSPSLIWNLNMMVSKFGISYSFWAPHFQVNQPLNLGRGPATIYEGLGLMTFLKASQGDENQVKKPFGLSGVRRCLKGIFTNMFAYFCHKCR